MFSIIFLCLKQMLRGKADEKRKLKWSAETYLKVTKIFKQNESKGKQNEVIHDYDDFFHNSNYSKI